MRDGCDMYLLILCLRGGLGHHLIWGEVKEAIGGDSGGDERGRR